MSNNAPKWGLIGLGVGIAAGIAAGVLLAPKSGKENREELVKQAGRAKAGASEQLKKAETEVAKLKSEVEKLKKKVTKKNK